MAFTPVQHAAPPDPVIVLLPDGSVRLYHEQCMQVRDVLKDFPRHDLASLNHTVSSAPRSLLSPAGTDARAVFPPSNAAPLPPERFLRPGGTYSLVKQPSATTLASDDFSSVHVSFHHSGQLPARMPPNLECVARGVADAWLDDDSDSPSGNAVVSCFTPRGRTSSAATTSASANRRTRSGLERASSMPPIQMVRAGLMPTTPRNSCAASAADPAAPYAEVASSPAAGARAPLPRRAAPLSRTTSVIDVPSTAAFPNLVSPRAPPSAASALVSPRASSSLISPRALLSGSRKLARALTALPRPHRSGNTPRERVPSDKNQIPDDVSNHGASGPWSLMDLVSSRAASATRGDARRPGDNSNSWEGGTGVLHFTFDGEEEAGCAQQGDERSSRAAAGAQGNARRSLGRRGRENWSGSLTPRGLPLLSPVETAEEEEEGGDRRALHSQQWQMRQQQQRRRRVSEESTRSTWSAQPMQPAQSTRSTRSVWSTEQMPLSGSLNALGAPDSSSTDSSTSNGSSGSGSASQTNAAALTSSASSSSSSKGRLEAASHRLALFKSLRLQVARPSADAVLGTNTTSKPAAGPGESAGKHSEGVVGTLMNQRVMNATNGPSPAQSPHGEKLAVPASGSGKTAGYMNSGVVWRNEWHSPRVLSAPNTPFPVVLRAVPDGASPRLSSTAAMAAGPGMQMQGGAVSGYGQPFPGSRFQYVYPPTATLHAMS